MVSLKLMRELERGYDLHDDLGGRYLTPTGYPYVSLTGLGGEDEAKKAFGEYAKDRAGILYWRVLPELNDGSYFMRLFIAKDLCP